MSNKFVNSPMEDSEFVHDSIPEGGPGTYNGLDTGPFGEYKRTPSPNAVREKNIDGSVPKPPSGESDHF